MMDSVETNGTITNSLTQIFDQKARDAMAVLKPISEEKLMRTEYAIKVMAQCVPDAILVGGWALRLHLKQKRLPIPTVPAIDIDYAISPAGYDQIRETLKFPSESDFELKGEPLSAEKKSLIATKLRRKGNKEPVPQAMGGGFRNFMKNPKNYMALEDGRYQQHIDLFGTNESVRTQKLIVGDVEVTVLTPEELLIGRYNQLNRYLSETPPNGEQPIEIPRKILQYFYLNGGIVDEQTLKELWEEKKTQGAVKDDFPQALLQLIDRIDEGLRRGTIKLVDRFH